MLLCLKENEEYYCKHMCSCLKRGYLEHSGRKGIVRACGTVSICTEVLWLGSRGLRRPLATQEHS